MPRIFISYRRADSQNITARIYEQLVFRYHDENVFFDWLDIPGGRDFRQVIGEAIDSADVLLVVIGPNWVNIADSEGKKRIDDINDFVRIEVESGLRRPNLLVIPVLVGGAKMPTPGDLPSTMQDLAFRSAVLVRESPMDFRRDIAWLIKQIDSGVLTIGKGDELRAKLLLQNMVKSYPWVGIASVAVVAILLVVLIFLVASRSTPQVATLPTETEPPATTAPTTGISQVIAIPMRETIGDASVYVFHDERVEALGETVVELQLFIDNVYVTPTPIGPVTSIPVTQTTPRPHVATPGQATATPQSAIFSVSDVVVPDRVVAILECGVSSFIGCGEKDVLRLDINRPNSWLWQLIPNEAAQGKQTLRLELWRVNDENIRDSRIWHYDFTIEIIQNGITETSTPVVLTDQARITETAIADTAEPTILPTETAIPTAVCTNTPEVTITTYLSETPTVIPITPTMPSDTPTTTDTFTATFAPSDTPTATNTFTATIAPSDTPTATIVPSDTPTATDTFTVTTVPSDTPTATAPAPILPFYTDFESDDFLANFDYDPAFWQLDREEGNTALYGKGHLFNGLTILPDQSPDWLRDNLQNFVISFRLKLPRELTGLRLIYRNSSFGYNAIEFLPGMINLKRNSGSRDILDRGNELQIRMAREKPIRAGEWQTVSIWFQNENILVYVDHDLVLIERDHFVPTYGALPGGQIIFQTIDAVDGVGIDDITIQAAESASSLLNDTFLPADWVSSGPGAAMGESDDGLSYLSLSGDTTVTLDTGPLQNFQMRCKVWIESAGYQMIVRENDAGAIVFDYELGHLNVHVVDGEGRETWSASERNFFSFLKWEFVDMIFIGDEIELHRDGYARYRQFRIPGAPPSGTISFRTEGAEQVWIDSCLITQVVPAE